MRVSTEVKSTLLMPPDQRTEQQLAKVSAGAEITRFCVTSPFVITEPTRDLLVPYTKQSSDYGWHISIIVAMFVNTKHRYSLQIDL